MGRDHIRVNAIHPSVVATPFITEPGRQRHPGLRPLLPRAVRDPAPG
ncbi:hypothetical protein ACH4U3_30325 [Streptomyces griseoruber]